jgi:hypothetical protein
LNARIDEPVDRYHELAMPIDTMEALREATRADGRPLVKSESVIAGPGERAKPEPRFALEGFAALMLILLIVGAFGRTTWARRVGGAGMILWGLTGGLVGLWCIVWTLLPYEDTHLSANVIAWSPLLLAFTEVGWKYARGRLAERARRFWLRALMVVIGLTLVELAGHVVGIGRQVHAHFTLYALVLSGLTAWMLIRATTEPVLTELRSAAEAPLPSEPPPAP